jgi:trimethylamine--corrinoid protein Co-methyltransferase
MDLRFATASMGSPEMSMIGAAVAQLARHYELPSNVGGGSDSKVSDGQAAHEITFSALLPSLAGANIMTGAGSLEMGITLSFDQMVSDCDFIRMIQHAVGGIPVRDGTLALDVIHDVGFSGDYLSHNHTLKHMRTAQVQLGLIDRRTREDWKSRGSTDIHQRAQERVRHILATHKPEPLSKSVAVKIRSIVEEAELNVSNFH